MPQFTLKETNNYIDHDEYVIDFDVSDEFVADLKHHILHQLLTDAYECGTHRYWHFTPTGRLSLKRDIFGSPDIRDYIKDSPEINAIIDQYLNDNPKRKEYEENSASPINGNVRSIIIHVAWQLVSMFADDQWIMLKEILLSGEHVNEKEKAIREDMRKAQIIVDRCNKQLTEMGVERTLNQLCHD